MGCPVKTLTVFSELMYLFTEVKVKRYRKYGSFFYITRILFFVTTLGCSSLILTPVYVYGSLPPIDPPYSGLSFHFPYEKTEKTTNTIKEKLPLFYHWITNHIHFPLMNGINELSPQQVLLGLKNLQFFLSEINNIQENITLETSYWEQLHFLHLTNDYLRIFQQLSHQGLVKQNYYQQLSDQYTAFLEDLTKYTSVKLAQNEKLQTVFRDFIAEESQIAIYSFLDNMPILPGIAMFALAASEIFESNADKYRKQIQSCNKGEVSEIPPDLYSDTTITRVCPKDGIDYSNNQNPHLLSLSSETSELCSLARSLKYCMMNLP